MAYALWNEGQGVSRMGMLGARNVLSVSAIEGRFDVFLRDFGLESMWRIGRMSS